MDSFQSTLFGASLGIANRGEVVGRDTIGEYTVDTCYTLDQGWETGLWKGDGIVVIVGRYATEEEAQEGHNEWCAACALEPKSVWSVQIDEYVTL